MVLWDDGRGDEFVGGGGAIMGMDDFSEGLGGVGW